MKILAVFLVVFLCIAAASAGNYACYAPPLVYGGVCRGSTAIFGSSGHSVRYSISQVNNVGTLICCQVQGCGPANSRACTSWGLYSVGCSTTSISVTVPWGNNLAQPAIKCYGSPFGTSIQWSA